MSASKRKTTRSRSRRKYHQSSARDAQRTLHVARDVARDVARSPELEYAGVASVSARVGATLAASAHNHHPSTRPAPKRRTHARRSARSVAAERRRRQHARQTQPNIADLPRSAAIAAVEAALRRRSAAITRPMAKREPAPSTPVTSAERAWSRWNSSAIRGITVFRRSAPVPELARLPRALSAPIANAAARAVRDGALSIPLPRSISRPAVSRPWLTRQRLFTLVALVALALALIPAPMLAYSNTMGLASDGVAHLKRAENDFKALASSPTNLAAINDAQSELQHAHDDFFQLRLRVALLSPASALPNAMGAKVAGAEKLLPLAVDGTQAGVLACDALKTLIVGLKNPLGTAGGLTSADMAQVTSDIDQLQALFTQMTPQIAGLTPADLALDPRLGPLVSQLQARLPQATQLVNDLDGLAHVLPSLLGVGHPSTYLVEVLDSSELRPTGGFIGNFGALTIDQGRLDPSFHISDITLIDSSVKFSNARYKQLIPIPAKYNWLQAVFVDPTGNSWSLRDSNLDPNYPTAAQYALQLYPRLLPDAQRNLHIQGSKLQLYDPAKSGQFAGVITLDLGFFAQALSVTGDLHVVDHNINEVVTANNFVSKIHSYALGSHATGPDDKACGITSCSKVFTSDVVKAFMAKVKSNLPLYIGKLGKLVFDSLRAKDVEVYLTSTPAQRLLHDLKLSAEVASPTTGDSVFEVDANIGANKDNYFLRYQMADQITLDPTGAATHRLAWSYRWPRDPATLSETFAAGSPDYHAYSRVFTPPNARLISQYNFAGFGSGVEFDRNTFHGSVTDSYGQTSTYGLSWTVPGVVTHDSAGYHYHLIFQREAGIVWPLSLSVTLPACATLVGAPVTSGLTSQDTVKAQGRTVTVSGPLAMDAQLEINYTCSALAASAHASPAFLTSKQVFGSHWRVVAARLGKGYSLRASR